MNLEQKIEALQTRLTKEGINNFFHSVCTTNGESHYFKFHDAETFAPVMKVRISGHSVTNINRLRDEVHFHGDIDQLNRIVEIAKSYM